MSKIRINELARELEVKPTVILDLLPELGETLVLTSICGLGQVALNPILSVLKHWPDEIRDPTDPRPEV